jgi:hypothetical protein
VTHYAKSDYHDAFPNGVPQPSRSKQGWGSGWPNCQPSKMKTVTGKDQTSGQSFDIKVTVRAEIAEMVVALLEATDKLYDLNQHDTGAYNCRPISGTNTASNHSWGLAIDLNWDDNPFTATFTSTIPPAVVAMWVACGWGWGGFYKGGKTDTMHFEYLGAPSDVAADTKKAQAYVTGSSTSSKLTQKQVLQLAVDAGFSRADANVMSVIAFYESGWDPKNIGDATLSKYGSRGLWQIFTKVHPPSEVLSGSSASAWTDALIKQLEDPAANAHAAHVVFKSQGFKAWSTWNNRAQHSGWAGLLTKAEAIDLGGTPPPPPPAPTYVAKLGKNAKPGKIDPTNIDLQRALIATGFANGIFTAPNPTGLYGGGTEKAVRKFFDKYPKFQSSKTDTAIGPQGWTFLRNLALSR